MEEIESSSKNDAYKENMIRFFHEVGDGTVYSLLLSRAKQHNGLLFAT